MRNTTAGIKAEIAKGVFRPHTALTNMALAYYQNASNYFAKALFPTCPVGLSSDNYYIFSREDLLRDNWQRKPAYGKVDPTTIGESTDNYVCKVDQMIMGIDQIRQTDLSRRQGPSIIQPKQQRTRTIAEQANIHQDRLFAASYFKEGAWKNELEGVDNTTPSTNQFIKFSNANSDPIAFIDKEKTDMNQQTGRMPNRLGLGINVFNALKVHPGILERVKYGGSTANPASVTENVLAQLFGVEKIVVLKSIMNSASMGADEEMQYIGDPNAFLLAYATNAPSIDEPSAGYIFTWDMLGNGQMLPILNYLGENGTHTEYIEGLMATHLTILQDFIKLQFKEEPMKLVANKPCNLNGKKYFIGEEVPVEEVVDYASLVKMGLLSVIHDAVPEDNLEECVAMVGEVSFSIPIVKGHETIDLDVTEPQMQDAVKTMQMSADAAVAHIRGNIEDDTTLIIINALDSRATVKKAAESKAKNLIEQEESKGDA